jgi:hypothetical protein
MKRQDRDLALVSGVFLEDKIPSDKHWLVNYFKTGVKFKFLVYYSIFRSHYYFSRHTGLHCTARYLCYLKNLLCDLENLHKKSKKDFDLDTLSLLESGKYKIERR